MGYQPRSNLLKDENWWSACRFPQHYDWVKELLLSVIECT
jgi:hypothetical protein